ncbi:preprotein translocase subunit SecY [Candidatus Saccharibacteria bacterium]|nr:preprotein translocase subunit SecY [Candidatus Saccharibacteria bacterium]
MIREKLTTLWKTPDLRSRLFVVLGILLAYSLLSHIPAPVPDIKRLQTFLLSFFNQTPVLGFANLFTGGALANFSIIAMGIGPYITASIVVQLLQQVVPSWEALSKEGERGRAKLNQYMRYLAVPMSIIQSFAVVSLVRQISQQASGTDLIGSPSFGQWGILILTLTAGSMLLMWLGELITERGFGNGISIIIAAGIIASLPGTITQQLTLLQGDSSQLIKVIVLAGISLVTIFGIVLVNEAQRNIPISYARRTAAIGTYGSVDTHLPLRLITAGVVPVIFALAFMSVPTFIGQLFQNAQTAWLASLAKNLTTWFTPQGVVYSIAYFVLIFAFTFFYTSIVFKPTEIAENLQKQGGFIPGIRPGKETAKYLKGVIGRLNLSGALALGIIAVLPFIVQGIFKTSSSFAVGGTGVFILVSVAIETVRQVQSRMLMATYEKY